MNRLMLVVAVWILAYCVVREYLRQELQEQQSEPPKADPAAAEIWGVLSEARRITREAADGMA